MEEGSGPVASPNHTTLGYKAATSIISHEHLTCDPNICSQPRLGCLHAALPQGAPGRPSFLLLAGVKN